MATTITNTDDTKNFTSQDVKDYFAAEGIPISGLRSGGDALGMINTITVNETLTPQQITDFRIAFFTIKFSELLARTDLEINATEIIVNIPANRVRNNYIIHYHLKFDDDVKIKMQFNGDTANNYDELFIENHSIVSDGPATDGIEVSDSALHNQPIHGDMTIGNILGEEKSGNVGNRSSTDTGTSSTVLTKQNDFKWINTASMINQIRLFVSSGPGNIETGSFITVEGYN